METSFTSIGVFALLGLGLLFGLKHATEVDHVVAVSTIVSEHRNVWRSMIVGALWGAGHTFSLVLVGLLVLVFRVAIPLNVASWLEFGVAVMIIALGAVALRKALWKRKTLQVHRHLHRHTPDSQPHLHVHFHETATAHNHEPPSLEPLSAEPSHSHAVSRLGLKPLLVGAMHGLAGSAALTLLILTQIPSVLLGLLYLGLFGVGSTLGMLLMSGLIGVPFALSAGRLSRVHYGLQTAAGAVSIAFGFWYAYETLIAGNLWRTIQ